MQIVVPKETHAGEKRVAVIPATAAKLVRLGAQVTIEAGLGQSIRYSDEEYTKVGVQVSTDRKSMLAQADMVLRVRKPPAEEVALLKRGCVHISYLDPFNEPQLVCQLCQQGVSTISMEMIPRITRAQKMDVLSSQANLAGYVAVILAASRLDRIFPMMMTAGGTLAPARVFVIGAGVAGLQAIATAKRLGARVDAFDTRPVVEEQVKSLGAKFLKVDLGTTGESQQGYAKALTPEQLAKQRQAMAKQCALSDVVITTAQLFGRKAPLIITQEMIAGMQPGSVIVDLAVESGGNVAGSVVDQEVEINGVLVIGLANLPSRVALHASQMYANNLFNLVQEFWDTEQQTFNLNCDDPIIEACLLTHQEEVRHRCFLEDEDQRASRLDCHPCKEHAK